MINELEQLSDERLETLFNHESDAVCAGHGDEMLLLKIANLLAERKGISADHDLAFRKKIQEVLPNASL